MTTNPNPVSSEYPFPTTPPTNPTPATILLTITLPPTYPDDPPLLDLSAPPNAPKTPLLDIHSDKPTLLTALAPTITENLGMAMIFTLVSALKEHAETLIAARQASAQAERDREATEREEEENRKFHGQAVTRESFWEWRERFRAEAEGREEEKRREREEGEGRRKGGGGEERMTGRELWERGMVGKMEEEEEEEGEAEGVERLRVAE